MDFRMLVHFGVDHGSAMSARACSIDLYTLEGRISQNRAVLSHHFVQGAGLG